MSPIQTLRMMPLVRIRCLAKSFRLMLVTSATWCKCKVYARNLRFCASSGVDCFQTRT